MERVYKPEEPVEVGSLAVALDMTLFFSPLLPRQDLKTLAELRDTQHYQYHSVYQVWWGWTHRFRLQIPKVRAWDYGFFVAVVFKTLLEHVGWLLLTFGL